MPGLDGEEVARRVLAARPDVRVVYMTGFAEAAIASHGALHGAADTVLHKPFTRGQLIRTVQAVLTTAATTGHR
jgi:FixJ family two-component response regulator